MNGAILMYGFFVLAFAGLTAVLIADGLSSDPKPRPATKAKTRRNR